MSNFQDKVCTAAIFDLCTEPRNGEFNIGKEKDKIPGRRRLNIELHTMCLAKRGVKTQGIFFYRGGRGESDFQVSLFVTAMTMMREEN